jgi:hypothetical protein
MTDSVSRSGKGGMLAPLTLADGTAGVPGLSWSSDTNSGFYRIGADNVGLSLAGAKVVDYAAGSYSFIDTAVTATVGPIFSIFRDSASPADADFIGEIRFDGEDDGSVKTTYAAISGQIDDVTGATEDGTLLVKTMTAGTLTTQLDISSAAVVVTPPTTLTGAVTATGGITSGGDILSDTDSTDSLGSTAVRWLKGWFDTLTAGTLTIGAGTITDSSGAISFGNENLTTTGNVDANGVEFDSLSGTGAVAITDIKDEDNMASDSATMLATQQSIKAYVDAQVDTVDTLSEVLAIGNTTGGTDVSVTTTDKVQFRDAAIYINSSVDGQLDIVADTEIQIAATTVDLNGNLDVSGTALVTGVLTTTGTQVATGGITSGSNIISDTDSTDSLGSTTVRWLKGWFDTLTAGTLTIGGGTITDSSGAITFGNENLVTTGTLGSGALTATTIAGTTGSFSGDVTIATAGNSEFVATTSNAVANAVSVYENSGDGNHAWRSGRESNGSWAAVHSSGATNGVGTVTAILSLDPSSYAATFARTVSSYSTASSAVGPAAITLDCLNSYNQLEWKQAGSHRGYISADGADTYMGAKGTLNFRTGSTSLAGGTTALILDASQNATFAGDVSVGGGTGAWLTAWKDNSNSGNQFLIGDTEGVNAAIRTYSTSDPAGLIMKTPPSRVLFLRHQALLKYHILSLS